MSPLPLAFLFLALSGLGGGENAPPGRDLATLRREARELEDRLRGLEQRQAVVGAEREKVTTELALATVRVAEAEAELAALTRAEGEAARAASQAQKKLHMAAEGLRAQLGVLATMGRAGLTPLLFLALKDDRELARRMTVTLAVVQEHKRRRDEIARLLDRRTATVAELSRRRESVAGGVALLAKRRAELDQARRRAQAELASLESERRAGAVALAEAREAEARLDRLWGSVAPEVEPDSKDFRLLRGGLPWPVQQARVERGFGTQRDPQYGTTTVSHGLFLAVPRGAEVRAIAAGKVAYAQFFRGYGNVVIVQHGGDVYSLYAQLSSIFPRAGQRVTIGEPLGVAGLAEGGQGVAYLEIRVGQQAQNPLAWLKPAGK